MILDTSFIIDLMNKDEQAVSKFKELTGKRESTFITAVSVFELFSGIAQSNKSENEKQKVMNAIADQLILSIDEEAAKKGGEIHGNLIKKGERIGASDCMIAGAAIIKNEKIITRNTKDFSKVANLEIESY